MQRAAESPYQGINVLVLWGHSVSKGYSAPIWMTFRQALELDAHVRKGERGSTVVYASKITRTGTDADKGDSELTAKFIDCEKRAMPADVAGSLQRAIEELPCGSTAVIAQLARAA